MSVTHPQDAQQPRQSAACPGPAESGNAPGDPYAWRLPQDVISLENFDFPPLHRRSEFDADRNDRVFLNELIMQFDCYDIRRFTMYCGISTYEMARAMIGCGIRLRLLTEWMNCHSPLYESTDTHHRTWDLSPGL